VENAPVSQPKRDVRRLVSAVRDQVAWLEVFLGYRRTCGLLLVGVSRHTLYAWKKRFDAWLAEGVDVYVYFKHEDAGKAPAYARQLVGKTN